MTLHFFGDSFTYGYNFSEDVREKTIYPHLLAKKLELNYINHAIPGSSTWRTARLISNLELYENDIVVISWGFPDRFEFPAEEKEKSYRRNNEQFVWMGDVVENYNDVYCRRFFPQILEDNVPAKFEVKQLAKITYEKFYNSAWFEEMFLVMFNATMNVLKNAGCKFVMFNAIDIPYKKSNKILDIPEYILGYKNTMSFKIRNSNEKKYWNEYEHRMVAEILYNSLKITYNI